MSSIDKMDKIEKLPTAGEPVRLRIESVTYQGVPEGLIPESDVVYEEGESEFPVDIEDAALRAMSAEAGDAGPMRTELVTEGRYSFSAGRITVTYDESELLEVPGTLTQITFRKDEPGLVAIVRSGTVSSMFVLEEGRHHTCEYNVGFMRIPMCFYAKRVRNTVSKGKGVIELDYSVEMNGAETQRTKMKITLG